MTGIPLDLRSPLPEELRRSLATLARSDELLHDPDPLAILGFFHENPADVSFPPGADSPPGAARDGR